MRKLKVAAIQIKLTDSLKENIPLVEAQVRKAHSLGAQVILPSELFEGHYFCKEEKEEFFLRAKPMQEHGAVSHFQKVARELGVVLPISFFEKDGEQYYNSLAMVDADGSILGVYRKSHIPDGPGYEEKFYFRPGNTGFKVWKTKFGTVGVGICWDQWFPECARSMTLQGAEILFYPTAIGSEPHAPELNTSGRWQKAMIGHAVSNVIPVVAANRTGVEGSQNFYGHSFIADEAGEIVQEMGDGKEGILTHEFDLEAIQKTRAAWGFFRDRRPELYNALTKV